MDPIADDDVLCCHWTMGCHLCHVSVTNYVAVLHR